MVDIEPFQRGNHFGHPDSRTPDEGGTACVTQAFLRRVGGGGSIQYNREGLVTELGEEEVQAIEKQMYLEWRRDHETAHEEWDDGHVF